MLVEQDVHARDGYKAKVKFERFSNIGVLLPKFPHCFALQFKGFNVLQGLDLISLLSLLFQLNTLMLVGFHLYDNFYIQFVALFTFLIHKLFPANANMIAT